jgi:FdrA protein
MADYKRCLKLPSTYRDSVELLKLSVFLENLSGVHRAAVMMGTPHNKSILREAGLLTSEGEQADVNDLLICVQANAPEAVEHVVQEANRRLAHRRVDVKDGGEMAPRTLETALERMPAANLACISVPGRYAGSETRKALQKGLHVFLFSDHVDLEAEAELKQLASKQGLLLMGPECGTAILNGVPLGFANQVPRGPVGLVSASGTGLQQVTCILAQQGIGVSQAFGVGGRDLDKRIGGHSTRAALRMLAADEDTKVIMLISKAPYAQVAGRLAQAAARVGKPCVLAFLGCESRFNPADTLHYAATLEHAALVAGALVRDEPVPSRPRDDLQKRLPSIKAVRAKLQPQQRSIRGLYCGGTLAYEALWLLRQSLGKTTSNLDGTFNTTGGAGHVILDLGAEEFTSGRPHPMIDPQLRHHQILDVARRPEVAVVLCDVILGWGAHPDPASALAAAWKEAKGVAIAEGRQMICIAAVCGTPEDPQGYDQQCRILRENGIILAENNAQAVRLAAAVVDVRTETGSTTPVAEGTKLKPPTPGPENRLPEIPAHLPALLATGPRVINLGLELFAAQLTACGVPVVHADWRPPAGGDTRLASLLERLR